MSSILSSKQRQFLAGVIYALAIAQISNCSGKHSNGTSKARGKGGRAGVVTAGTSSTLDQGGADTAGTDTAGADTAGTDTAGTAGTGSQYTVAMVQSSKENATDISQADVMAMVSEAITNAGGLGFIVDGQTVVLKPNLVTPYVGCWSSGTALPQTVNGVTTDWRVTKAVADLVRSLNPTGKILVMEGSNRNTTTAFSLLGYTSANFGSSVDEFIALEGSGCSNRSTAGLIQKPGASGKQYWVNEQYFNADLVISIGAMKTHSSAGITGCVKNVGIGTTPNSQYSVSTNAADCTRNMSQSSQASYIDHSTLVLSNFISDYYSIRPPDFAVMDGLQGLQHGPCTANAPASDKMNMRLILASRNAVALDTIETLVMGCDPQLVPHLTNAAANGLGTTDPSNITLVGTRQDATDAITVDDVRKPFASGVPGVCN